MKTGRTTAAPDLLLPLEALCRGRVFSRPRALSAPSFALPDFSFPRTLFFSSSFFFVGEGALSESHKSKIQKFLGMWQANCLGSR